MTSQVSKQFPLSALHRPSYCELLLYSSSPVSAPEDGPTMERKLDGATGSIPGHNTSTAFDDHSLLPNGNSKNNVTGLLQDARAEITICQSNLIVPINTYGLAWKDRTLRPHRDLSWSPCIIRLAKRVPKLPRSGKPDRAEFSKVTERLAPSGLISRVDLVRGG